MYFRKITHSLLILITLAWSTSAYSEHIDIGYKNGYAVEAVFSTNDYIYMHTERTGEMFSYGVGVGLKNDYLTATVMLDRVTSVGDSNISTTAKLLYNDRVISYLISVGYTGKIGMSYRFGIGYNLSEKLSIVSHYSETGFFLGFRRWL